VSPDSAWTVIYCFPGAFAPGQSGHPDGWSDIPGARGCTLESETYRDRHAEFVDLDAAIHGISTQRSDQQSAFSTHAGLPFTLLSDVDLAFAAALRLPTFHVAGVERLKRLTLVADPERVIRHVDYPIEDPVGSVHNALEAISAMSERSRR
jgi:peroxiredoxin